MDDVACHSIARWDDVAWSSLGATDGDVFSAGIYDDELILGGYFTRMGDVACEGIARWDGTGWQPLGGGVDSARGLGGL